MKPGKFWTRFGITASNLRNVQDKKQWLIDNAFALRFMQSHVPGTKEFINLIFNITEAPEKYRKELNPAKIDKDLITRLKEGDRNYYLLQHYN